jgi:hypothetical protein
LSNVRLKWAYIVFLRVKKAVIQEEGDGKSQPPLHSRLHLAHYPPLPSEPISSQILQGSPPVPSVAASSPEAEWPAQTIDILV